MSETKKKQNQEKHMDLVKGNKEFKKSGAPVQAVKEIGGQKGPEPTRYGDWEKGGRCTDF